MLFQIDFKSGKPVYLQLVDQVRYAAASGGLRAGEPLPPIRARGCVKTADMKFGNDQIFDMENFDKTSRWIGWSKMSFYTASRCRQRGMAVPVPLRGSRWFVPRAWTLGHNF